MKRYIVPIEQMEGEDVQIYVTVGSDPNATAYAVLAVDELGASIVDNGYSSIEEARESWPEAIAPNPAQHLTPQQAEANAITAAPWGEGRRAFILTDAQAELVADALEIVSPNDERMEEQAQALAVQFRSSHAPLA
jgi:hypothetical protein